MKESMEEASIPANIAKQAELIDFIQHAYHDDFFITREFNYIYDMELPSDFTPQTNDGETLDFRRVKLVGECENIFYMPDEWKPNCFALSLDFAIRKNCFKFDDSSKKYMKDLLKNKEIFADII